MGWEGANVIFDDWVHPLMMGLEEHLIDMFKHDFEFVDGHQSHLAHTATKLLLRKKLNNETSNINIQRRKVYLDRIWQSRTYKSSIFVRGKVKSNTEKICPFKRSS